MTPGGSVEVVVADLSKDPDLARVEQVRRSDARTWKTQVSMNRRKFI